MKQPYSLVVFDWEGTIGDPLGNVVHAVRESSQYFSDAEWSEQQARLYLPLGLDKALEKMYPKMLLLDKQQLMQRIAIWLSEHSNEVYLLPGVKDWIAHLHHLGVDLAIATNKGKKSLKRVLQVSGLDAFFVVTRSADVVPMKPCPQMLQEIMDVFAKPPSETLMIGDSLADIQMATSLGVTSIGVDFYHQSAQALLDAGAKVVFDEYDSLAKYLDFGAGR